MILEVRLYATLRRYVPTSPNGVIMADLPHDATVLELVQHLNIDPADIHLIMINGLGREFEAILTEGDRVGLFPAIGGG